MQPRGVRAFLDRREDVLKVLEAFGAVEHGTHVLDLDPINATYIFPINVPADGVDQFQRAVSEAGGIFLNRNGHFLLGPLPSVELEI